MFENEDTAAGGYWQWYRDVDGQTGQTYYLPTATVTVQIREDHTWDSGEQTKAPTCTEAGEVTYICDVCGETKTEVGDPARGHQMGDFVVTKEPTATEMGEETAKCANCDYTETRQIPVKVEQERITVGSASLSFEDEVVVNLYYTTTDMPGVTAENMGLLTWTVQPVEGTIDDADQVLPGALYDEAKGHYMVQTRGIAAKNLGDDIYMRVYAKLADGSYIYSNLVTYSPKKYALSRLGGDPALAFQLPIGALDGVGIDGQLPGQLPHRGKFLPGEQDACLDLTNDAVDDLGIHRPRIPVVKMYQ
jgi:hypothetical protein